MHEPLWLLDSGSPSPRETRLARPE